MKVYSKYIDYLVWICAAIFCVLAALVSVNLHLQFGTGYYDFGIFDTALWKIAHFQPPIIDHYVLGGKLHMGDHFTPSLYMFAPLYWFTDSQLTMFIAQAIVVSLSAVVMYYVVKRMTSNILIALAAFFGYIGFVGIHSALYFDIHSLTFMTLFLALAYWALVHSRKKLFITMFILTLGFKESLFLLGAGLAVVAYFYNKSWRKLAIILFFASFIWGFLAIKVIIPTFSGVGYFYEPPQTRTFVESVQQLYTPHTKLTMIFWSFVNFAMLPLLGFETFFIMATHYVSRFLTLGSTRWWFNLHYNAEIAPTLVFAAGLGYNRLVGYLPKFKKHMSVIALIGTVSAALFISTVIERSPLFLAFMPAYYQATENFEFLENMVAQVPEGASVMSQNNILAHFTHHDAWLTRNNYEDYKPDYILFDRRDGQNEAQVLERGDGETEETYQLVSKDPKYELIWHEGDQYVFKRIAE